MDRGRSFRTDIFNARDYRTLGDQMTASFLIPNRTVLLVTDEALYIYSTGSRGVRLVETVPWEAENFEQNVATVISKKTNKRSAIL